MKTTRELEKKMNEYTLFTLLMAIIFSFFITNITLFFYHQASTETTNQAESNYDLSIIDKINEDCGSTYIVKKYGEKEWSVFKNICLQGGYCKYDYIKIKDCLNDIDKLEETNWSLNNYTAGDADLSITNVR